MKLLNFESQNLVVDWISFNIQGLPDPITIASGLSKHFTPHVLIAGEPTMSYHGFKKKSKVSIWQYTGSKGYWVGTQIIFSGKDASRCYNLIKTQKFDLETLMLDQHTLSLGRIDLCFSRTNGPNDTIKFLSDTGDNLDLSDFIHLTDTQIEDGTHSDAITSAAITIPPQLCCIDMQPFLL